MIDGVMKVIEWTCMIWATVILVGMVLMIMEELISLIVRSVINTYVGMKGIKQWVVNMLMN